MAPSVAKNDSPKKPQLRATAAAPPKVELFSLSTWTFKYGLIQALNFFWAIHMVKGELSRDFAEPNSPYPLNELTAVNLLQGALTLVVTVPLLHLIYRRPKGLRRGFLLGALFILYQLVVNSALWEFSGVRYKILINKILSACEAGYTKPACVSAIKNSRSETLHPWHRQTLLNWIPPDKVEVLEPLLIPPGR